MSVQMQIDEISPNLRKAVQEQISAVIRDLPGKWYVKVIPDLSNYAWDVEVRGPRSFHWHRRFSAGDRDAEVIAEAVRDALAMAA